MDLQSNNAVSDVSIGRTDTSDLDNPFNGKTLTKEDGEYEIHGISGSCNEITLFFAKSGYSTRKVILKNYSVDTIFLEPNLKQRAAHFDNKQAFEIVGILRSNDYPSSDSDTSTCITWILTESNIKHLIKEARPISGSQWHDLFEHFPCQIHGSLIQNSTAYQYSINSGAWLTISSADTTVRFGSFKRENDKYFLSNAWTMEDMENGE